MAGDAVNRGWLWSCRAIVMPLSVFAHVRKASGTSHRSSVAAGYLQWIVEEYDDIPTTGWSDHFGAPLLTAART